MYTLIIGNRTYSSWSLRGWLACKASGLEFETVVLPMDTPAWDAGSSKGELPSSKVPTLWHTDATGQRMAIWDSLAIIDWLADKVRTARISRGHYWPQDWAARALARSISAACLPQKSSDQRMRASASPTHCHDPPNGRG